MRLVALDAIESLIVTTTVQQWIWGDGARAGFFLNDSAPGIPNTVYTGVGDLSMVASRHCWLHSQLRPPAHLLSHHHHYHHHTHHDLQSNIFYKWKDMSSLCSVQACGSAGYWGKEITVTGTTGYQFAPEVDPETAPPPSYVMGGALAPSVVLADCRSINEYRRFVVWSSELLRPFNILTTPVVPSLKVQGLLVDRYRIDNAYVVWCLLAATSLSLSLSLSLSCARTSHSFPSSLVKDVRRRRSHVPASDWLCQHVAALSGHSDIHQPAEHAVR